MDHPVFLHEAHRDYYEDGDGDGNGVVHLTHGRRDDHGDEEEKDEGVPELVQIM